MSVVHEAAYGQPQLPELPENGALGTESDITYEQVLSDVEALLAINGVKSAKESTHLRPADSLNGYDNQPVNLPCTGTTNPSCYSDDDEC